MAHHGTYERKTPEGCQIARWYCRESHTSFSGLPDCLAARLPGTLDELEAVVVMAEEAGSLEEAANEARCPEDEDAIELPGALRWLRRRLDLIYNVLARVIGLIPQARGLRAHHERGARASGERQRVDGAARPGRRATADAARAPGLPTPRHRRGESQICDPTTGGA